MFFQRRHAPVHDAYLLLDHRNAAQLSVLASILDTTPQYLCDESDEVSPISSDDELEQLLTALRDREDMRLLFKLAKDATPDDVRQAVKIIEALRASE